MNELDETALGIEHRRYTRHIAGVDPSEYQIQQYVAFHRDRVMTGRGRFDTALFRLSGWGAIGLALADAYSGNLFRNSLVRRKLVLSLAIIECSPPTFAVLDRPDSGKFAVFSKMAWRCLVAAALLFSAALLLGPFHALFAVTGRLRGKRA